MPHSQQSQRILLLTNVFHNFAAKKQPRFDDEKFTPDTMGTFFIDQISEDLQLTKLSEKQLLLAILKAYDFCLLF